MDEIKEMLESKVVALVDYSPSDGVNPPYMDVTFPVDVELEVTSFDEVPLEVRCETSAYPYDDDDDRTFPFTARLESIRRGFKEGVFAKYEIEGDD